MQKIAIHSVPRSGSTWLGEIFNSSPVVKYCFQPLFSYKLKDYLDEFSDKASIEIFFRSLLETSDEFICQNLQREMGALPSFRKSASITHVVYKEVRYHHILKNLIEKDKELRLILLVRDPIEVMNSWINSPREFDPSWSINDQLNTAPLKNLGQKENFFGLNAWIKTSNSFESLVQSHPDRALLVKYTDLVGNPVETVKRIFVFCGLPLGDQTQLFLSESVTKKVDGNYSVYRGNKKSKITLSADILFAIKKAVRDAQLNHLMDN